MTELYEKENVMNDTVVLAMTEMKGKGTHHNVLMEFLTTCST